MLHRDAARDGRFRGCNGRCCQIPTALRLLRRKRGLLRLILELGWRQAAPRSSSYRPPRSPILQSRHSPPPPPRARRHGSALIASQRRRRRGRSAAGREERRGVGGKEGGPCREKEGKGARGRGQRVLRGRRSWAGRGGGAAGDPSQGMQPDDRRRRRVPAVRSLCSLPCRVTRQHARCGVPHHERSCAARGCGRGGRARALASSLVRASTAVVSPAPSRSATSSSAPSDAATGDEAAVVGGPGAASVAHA